jgi:hypothetical protein
MWKGLPDFTAATLMNSELKSIPRTDAVVMYDKHNRIATKNTFRSIYRVKQEVKETYDVIRPKT